MPKAAGRTGRSRSVSRYLSFAEAAKFIPKDTLRGLLFADALDAFDSNALKIPARYWGDSKPEPIPAAQPGYLSGGLVWPWPLETAAVKLLRADVVAAAGREMGRPPDQPGTVKAKVFAWLDQQPRRSLTGATYISLAADAARVLGCDKQAEYIAQKIISQWFRERGRHRKR